MVSTLHTRRAVFGAMALAPVVMTVPAMASCTSPCRHSVWASEHAATLRRCEAASAEVAETMYPVLSTLERKILKTEVANLAEARSKMQFLLTLQDQGSVLDGDDASDLVRDISRFML